MKLGAALDCFIPGLVELHLNSPILSVKFALYILF